MLILKHVLRWQVYRISIFQQPLFLWKCFIGGIKYIAAEFRGPLIGKHPYLPDNIKVVTFGYVSDDIVDRLHGYWNQYIGKKK